MSQEFKFEPKAITADQCKLLHLIYSRVPPNISPHDWDTIATELGTNGKAVKERFRYLMCTLGGVSAKGGRAPRTTPKSFTPQRTGSKAGTSSAMSGYASLTPDRQQVIASSLTGQKRTTRATPVGTRTSKRSKSIDATAASLYRPEIRNNHPSLPSRLSHKKPQPDSEHESEAEEEEIYEYVLPRTPVGAAFTPLMTPPDSGTRYPSIDNNFGDPFLTEEPRPPFEGGDNDNLTDWFNEEYNRTRDLYD